MKKRVFFLFTSGVFVLIFSLAFVILPGGSPGGKTGSPIDGSNCTSCHGGSAETVTGWITSNIPVEGYTPGQAYTVTVTATGSGTKGFEITAETASAKTGTFAAGVGSKLVNSNLAVTHSAAVTTATATWNFTWTAPTQSTGNVTFYSAAVVNKPNIKLCTLQVAEKPTGIDISNDESTVSVFPNPARETLNFTLVNAKNARYQIFSFDGKLMLADNAVNVNSVNISLLSAGSYILTIYNGDKLITKSFIKE
jgi:hypothetical protein